MASEPTTAKKRSSKKSNVVPPPSSRGATGIALAMIIAGFLPGLMIGIALSHSPSFERCNVAPDPFVCLINSLD